jgi:peptidyl-prolyl cis-trans isomerase A (cyclophilin A)
MDVVDKLYAGYGEGAPSGKGPNQGLIQAKGNEYLENSYPKLSYISKATFSK